MVILYHPGYIPGSTYPVADDYYASLEGDTLTCQRQSVKFSKEPGYYEFGQFADWDEANE